MNCGSNVKLNLLNICSVRKTRLKAHQLGGGGEPSKARSASACRSTDKGSAAAAAMARLELEECESSNSGSLEDLVNSFDEKLTAVLQNYQEQVDKIAPVQVSNVTKFGYFYSIYSTSIVRRNLIMAPKILPSSV